MPAQLYLSSASPRRKQLLTQMGIAFEVVEAGVDESPYPGELPREYVVRVARLKAETAARRLEAGLPVLAADTVVVLEGERLGKPRDRSEGLSMLARLSGRRHQVLSAIALWRAGRVATALSESQVSFRVILPAEAEAYWATGEPADKAGAYGIQGLGGVFVQSLEGSYSGVMGLPLFETMTLLQEAGIRAF